MAEPENLVLVMLRELRAENLAEHGKTQASVTRLERRIAKLEENYKIAHQAMVADTLMSKLVTGEFEERIEALEKQVAKLVAHK
jgi:polyhydroxyalkanoate synthesis regulator phasin